MQPTVRILSVDEGEIGTAGTDRLTLVYDLGVAGDEQRAWRALLEALGGEQRRRDKIRSAAGTLRI